MDMGPPIEYPSICLIKWLLAEKIDSFVNFIKNFLKIDFLGKGFNFVWYIYVLECTQLSQQLERYLKSDPTS